MTTEPTTAVQWLREKCDRYFTSLDFDCDAIPEAYIYRLLQEAEAKFPHAPTVTLEQVDLAIKYLKLLHPKSCTPVGSPSDHWEGGYYAALRELREELSRHAGELTAPESEETGDGP